MLIAVPVYDTEANGRAELTQKVLPQLLETISAGVRVVVYDNGSCAVTKDFLTQFNLDHPSVFDVVFGDRNIGIADAVNRIWRNFSMPNEVLCKMDNDCFIRDKGWTDVIKFAFKRNPDIGILGLKRKDVEEHPNHIIPHYKSRMYYVNHKPGEKWIPIEEVNHVMGTCYSFNPSMLRHFGYLQQPDTVYGFDDATSAVRAHKIGYKTCFLPHIEIDHLDIDLNSDKHKVYTEWKSQQAEDGGPRYSSYAKQIKSGKLSAYYDGGF